MHYATGGGGGDEGVIPSGIPLNEVSVSTFYTISIEK